MGIQRHVTSEAIVGLADDLDGEVRTQVTTAKQRIEECRIDGFPGFGVVGLPLQITYNGVIDDFQGFLDRYSETMADVAAVLRTRVAPAWQEAELNNTVRYGDQ